MRRSHRKSRLAPFRAENIFRKSQGRNFGCWSRCLSNVQKCVLGVILPTPSPGGHRRVNGKVTKCCFIFLRNCENRSGDVRKMADRPTVRSATRRSTDLEDQSESFQRKSNQTFVSMKSRARILFFFLTRVSVLNGLNSRCHLYAQSLSFARSVLSLSQFRDCSHFFICLEVHNNLF